jgi:hypothetical protein
MVSLSMDAVSSWRDVFRRWPTEMPRRGVLVVAFGEQIPFSGFSASEAMLLLERQSPDSMGTRTILLPYDQVLGLKIVDVVKPRTFHSLGFDMPVQK